MVVGGPGNEDAAWLGEGLETRRNVDPVSVEVAALEHHVAEIDADAKHDMAVAKLPAIGGGHAGLEVHRALHRIDGAGELDQHAVARNLEDPPLILRNQGFEHVLAPGLQGGQRAGFVLLHEPAVADDISGEDGGKPALDAVILGHEAALSKVFCRQLYGPAGIVSIARRRALSSPPARRPRGYRGRDRRRA